jgi:hypothetical protein
VLADAALVVEHPAGELRMRELEPAQDLADRAADHRDLSLPAGAFSQRGAETDDSHGSAV